MNKRTAARYGRQRGVALAIVVWFIAGMSLLVAGIVNHARMDAKMAQAHVARAKTVAAGDGAIRLLLAERQAGLVMPTAAPGTYRGNYRLGDTPVRVMLYPARGLLDLNAASEIELSALFSTAAGLDTGAADALAVAVVEWRRGGGVDDDQQQRRRNRFVTGEDLLRVEGIGRTLYDAVRDCVVAGRSASGRIDWTYSPIGLLSVLETIDPQRVSNVMERRADLVQSAAAGGLPGARVSAGAWRADALVSYGGRQWLRRHWISPGQDAATGLPWRVVRTEPPRVVPGQVEG